MSHSHGPAQLELDDIQGILRRGYGALGCASYVVLRIEQQREARRWLGELTIRDGLTSPIAGDTCVNVAFTYAGLDELGLRTHPDQPFAIEFVEGMTRTHRARVLGDHGRSHPEEWKWGGTHSPPVHILLMLFADSEPALDALVANEQRKWVEAGLIELANVDGRRLPGRKEHFGFRDGIAQPQIAGLIDKLEHEDEIKRSNEVLIGGGSSGNVIAAGEFVLGYRNVYRRFPATPMVGPETDPFEVLPRQKDGEVLRDFGRNGSYLVFRQLSQDVQAFWQYLTGVTTSLDEADRLAAKMVGRWRGGAPLVLSPDKDDPQLADSQDFNYYEADVHGDRCPIASHVRRTNPRDSKNAGNKNPAKALADANKHRIIRRGRPYGPPLARSMDPADILAAKDDGDRGLAFLCFNANIGRQFEFIQQTWINNPKFDGLYAAADPLLGDAHPKAVERGLFGDFVEPSVPVRKSQRDLKRFVEVRGGGYFFLPGLRAIQYIAALVD